MCLWGVRGAIAPTSPLMWPVLRIMVKHGCSVRLKGLFQLKRIGSVFFVLGDKRTTQYTYKANLLQIFILFSLVFQTFFKFLLFKFFK